MYRQYENPYELQEQLKQVDAQIKTERDRGRLIDLMDERNDLLERINFAWQDDEAEVEGYE